VRLLTGLFMGTFMSFFMSGFITAVNTGIDAGLPFRWLAVAFPLAWVVAVPLAVLFGPVARQLAERMARTSA
jgi:hypothetical protein